MAYSCDRFLIFFLAALAAEAVNMHTIKVGFAGSPNFDPATTMADVEDVIVFEFYSTNHSIARGEYVESKACGSDSCNPCVPYELIHPEESGFHSDDFITERVSNNPDIATFNITIGDSFPIWFYCAALDSCHPNGMIGVINPAEGQSVDKQKSAAINADYQLVPGQSWPEEGSSSESQSTSSSVPSAESKDEKKLSGGAIAGIIIGMLLLAVLVTAGLVFALRRARQKKTSKDTEDDSISLTGDGAEEQTVPIALEIEPTSLPVHPGLVNDSSPPLGQKPMMASNGHLRTSQVELREEESHIGRASQ